MKFNKTCVKCEKDFGFLPEDTWWNENGSESVKLVKCEHCETVQRVRYWSDYIYNPNIDKRFYSYGNNRQK